MWAYWKTHKEKWQDIFVMCVAILGSILFFRYLFPIILPFLIGWLLSKTFGSMACTSMVCGVMLHFAIAGNRFFIWCFDWKSDRSTGKEFCFTNAAIY